MNTIARGFEWVVKVLVRVMKTDGRARGASRASQLSGLAALGIAGAGRPLHQKLVREFKAIRTGTSLAVFSAMLPLLAPLGVTATGQTLTADDWVGLLFRPESQLREGQALAADDDFGAAPPPIFRQSNDFADAYWLESTTHGRANAATFQNSRLGPDSLVIEVGASIEVYPPSGGQSGRVTASAQSRCVYGFRLNMPARLRVHSVQAGIGVSIAATLSGVSIAGSTDRVLLLQSGVHQLSVVVSTSASGWTNGERSASFGVEIRQDADLPQVEVIDLPASEKAGLFVLPASENERKVRLQENIQQLWANGIRSQGVAADGVTPMLIRIRVRPGAQAVGLALQSGPGEANGNIGTLDTVATWNSRTFQQQNQGQMGTIAIDSLPIAVQETVSAPGFSHQQRFAYAIYTPPKSFVDDTRGNRNGSPRRVAIRAVSVSGGVPVDESETLLPIYRAPIVLLHGLEDVAESWKWKIKDDNRFDVYAHDYRNTHNVRISSHTYQHHTVKAAVDIALNRLRSRGIAVSQIDIFGHSMGGLIVRDWANADNLFLRAENFFRGDYRRIITVDTPHFGSPLACMVSRYDGSLTPYGQTYGGIVDWIDTRCAGCGAAADLRPDSDFLSRLNGRQPIVPVPVHAIVGVGGNDLVSQLNGYWLQNSVFVYGPCDDTMSSIFGEDHDTIVSASSQSGGLPTWATSSFDGVPGLHGPVISEVENCVPLPPVCVPYERPLVRPVQLVDGDLGSFETNFPLATRSYFCSQASSACSIKTAPIGAVQPIVIISPDPFAQYASGQVVTVTIQANRPIIELEVRNGREYIPISVPIPAPSFPRLFDATFVIPSSFVGPMDIDVVARESVGSGFSFAWPASITLQVQPPTAPSSLEAPSGPIRLSAASSMLSVPLRGSFPDGVTRTLEADIRTTWTTDDASVATVSASGIVTARGLGTTNLTITNRGRQLQVPVTVESICGDDNGDGIVGTADAAAMAAALTGPAGSPGYVPPPARLAFIFDLDGDSDIDCDDALLLARIWTATGPVTRVGECLPPCPADLDDGSNTGTPDGGVTIDDLLYFLNQYAQGTPRADLDDGSNTGTPDGGVTIDDLLYFLARYAAGC